MPTSLLSPSLTPIASPTATPTPACPDCLPRRDIQTFILWVLGIAFGAVILYRFLLLWKDWHKPEGGKAADSDTADADFRHKVTTLILYSAIWGLIVLGLIIIIQATELRDSKEIFNLLLPVFGTWVGTLLAFYFSKENFEAATQSVTAMAQQVTGAGKLQSTTAQSVMLKPDQIRTVPDEYIGKKVGDPSKEIKLAKLLTYLDSAAVNKDRLPLFKDSQEAYAKTGAAAGVLHASTMQAFISKTAANAPTTKLVDLSLNDLINDTTFGFKSVFDNSFGVVAQDAILARAKAIMDNLSDKIDKRLKAGCYDVFVTSTGDDKEAVIGWITNDIINENATV